MYDGRGGGGSIYDGRGGGGGSVYDGRGGGYDNRGMRRSTSMVDIASSQGNMRGPSSLRRSQSVVNLPTGGPGDNRAPSPTGSQWSVRTAPHQRGPPSVAGSTRTGYPQAPSSVAGGRMKRSMSQPDLRGGGGGQRTMTYPQGILKRSESHGAHLDDVSSRYHLDKTNMSADSGVKDLYYDQDFGRMAYASSDRGYPDKVS